MNAKKLGVIDDFTNLITFDLHDDAKPIHQQTDILLDKWLEIGLSEISSRDFKNFIEYDISEYDDDWVNIGLELGLINNIINIGCEENSNIQEWENNTYTSKSGKKHYGFVLRHLKDELNRHGGNIGDVAIKRNDIIRDILGYSHDSAYPSISNKSNFVLDFDLDCFSTMCMGIELHSVYLNAGVAEIMHIVVEAVDIGSIEAIVMVATDEYFVFVWQVAEPVEKINGFLLCSDHTEITGMYHHIGLGQIPEAMVAVVSVREMEYFHKL